MIKSIYECCDEIYNDFRKLVDMSNSDNKKIDKLIMKTLSYIEKSTCYLYDATEDIEKLCISYYATYLAHLKVNLKRYKDHIKLSWPFNMTEAVFCMPMRCHDHMIDYAIVEAKIIELNSDLLYIINECMPDFRKNFREYQKKKRAVEIEVYMLRRVRYTNIFNPTISENLGTKLFIDFALCTLQEGLSVKIMTKIVLQLKNPNIETDLNIRKMYLKIKHTDIQFNKYNSKIKLPKTFYML